MIIHTSKVLNVQERALLEDAVTIISKESESRELLLQQFTDAFRKANISPGAATKVEEQHCLIRFSRKGRIARAGLNRPIQNNSVKILTVDDNEALRLLFPVTVSA